jgi:hypothetical protein
MCPASVAHASERRRKLVLVFGSMAASAACKLSAALLRHSSAVIIATISLIYRLVENHSISDFCVTLPQRRGMIDPLAFERKADQNHFLS